MPYRPSSPIRSGLPAPYLMEEQLGETLAREKDERAQVAEEAAVKPKPARSRESLRERLEHALHH